jgi:DNA-binding transcriptional ArsR family regulator
MSQRTNPAARAATRAQATLFAALGDSTRLQLIQTLSLGTPRSISELSNDSHVTRQAITKHLRVLESAGLVSGARLGRETRFTFSPEQLDAAREYLADVARQWDAALGRLKAFVEAGPKKKA